MAKHQLHLQNIFKMRTSNAVAKYLKTFPTLEKLEDEGLLKVDLRHIRVEIDYRLHMQFMDDDTKYLNFFKKVRAWMNYRRGFLQVKKVLQEEDRIDFTVFRKETVYLINGKETELPHLFDATPEDTIDTKTKVNIFLVGYVQGEELDYTPYRDNTDS